MKSKLLFCLLTLDVKIDDSLRGKRWTVVFTGHRSNPSRNEEFRQEEQASSNHVTVREVDDSNSKIELTEIPKTLKDKGNPQLMNSKS